MNFEFDPTKLLTDEQKREIADATHAQILKAIHSKEFERKLADELSSTLSDTMMDDDFTDAIDFEKLGKAFGKKIFDSLK